MYKECFTFDGDDSDLRDLRDTNAEEEATTDAAEAAAIVANAENE